MNFVDVGFQNLIETNKIISVVSPESSPMKKSIKFAKENGKFFDLTHGKRTRSIVITQCGDSVLMHGSAVHTNTIQNRIRKAKQEVEVNERETGDIVSTTVVH